MVIELNLLAVVLCLFVISYQAYKLIQLLLKMKQEKLAPITAEELAALRKYPQKPVDAPVYFKQRTGLIIECSMLLFLMVVLFMGLFFDQFDWPFFFFILLPFSYSNDVLNLFAVVEDGLLSGNRFIAWDQIKSFQFVPIDLNHRYYGFDKEVNEGYELIIKRKVCSTSCIVTSAEMKEKLTALLHEHASRPKEKEKAPIHAKESH